MLRPFPWKVRRSRRDDAVSAQRKIAADLVEAQQKIAADLADQCLKGDATLQVTFTAYIFLLGFLAAQTYSITHEQLLLDSVVNISLGQVVGFKQSTFYWTAPLVFVGLHFRVVWLIRAAAERVNLFREKIAGFSDAVKRDADTRVASMLLSYIVEGAQPLRSTLQAAMIALVGVFPVILMLQVQLAFLPYHSEAITWIHRASVFACVGLGWWSFAILRTKAPVNNPLRRACKYLPHSAAFSSVVVCMVVLVLPNEALERIQVVVIRSLVPWLVAEPYSKQDPTSFPERPFPINYDLPSETASFLSKPKGVAHELRRYRDSYRKDACDLWSSSGGCRNATPALAPVAYLFASASQWSTPDSFRLRRNIEIPDDSWLNAARLTATDRKLLQEHTKVAPLTPTFAAILEALPRQSFAGRDLRYARMRGAWLINTDLDEARIDGIDLQGARLFGARLSIEIESDAHRLDGIDISGGKLKLMRATGDRVAGDWRGISNVAAIAAIVILDGYELTLRGWDLRQSYIGTEVNRIPNGSSMAKKQLPRHSIGGALTKNVQPEGLVFSYCDLSFANITFDALMRFYSIRVEYSDATGVDIWNGKVLDDSEERQPAELVFIRSLVDWAQIFLDRQSSLHFIGTVPYYTSVQAQNARATLPTGSIGVRTIDLLPWSKFQARSKFARIDREFAPCVNWRKSQGCVPIVASNAAAFAKTTANQWCDRYRKWPFVPNLNAALPKVTMEGILERLHEVSSFALQQLIEDSQKCMASADFKNATWVTSIMASEISSWRRKLSVWSLEKRVRLGLTGRPAVVSYVV